MSLEIREPVWEDDYENKYCTKCGRTNIAATIEAENVKIFVCEDCLNELKSELDECLNKASRRCEKCEHFLGDKWDWVHYSGRCPKQDRDCPHDYTCNEFVKRETPMKFKTT